MKITDIKQQVSRKDRYSIYADGKYVFSLSEQELLATGIRINQEYTTDQFEELKNKAVLDKAYFRVLNLLARRARSEWEIRDYLKRKDCSKEDIETVVNKLRVNKLINDEEFARQWIESRRLLKPTSTRKLKLELRQKRIADSIIQEVLGENTDADALRELVEKKRKQTKYQDPQKLMQYLTRQGFNYEDIKEVLK